ncbi:MAG: carboxymuconolactone decarboxylase family protein [Actinobacteria bacterium]|nr:carboxymuconolactone decarboxylase family protein [Actinomycetota bacterium]
MARLEPELARQAAREAGVPSFMASLSIFQVLLHHLELSKAVNDLLMTLLSGRYLDPRLRELVIMRVGWTTRSCYEWTQHWKIAQDLGVSPEDLLALRDWRSQGSFSLPERCVLALTDELLSTGEITQPTWQSCKAALGEQEETVLELVTTIGAWRMISYLARGLEIPLEEGVAPWPPDGIEPPLR